MPLTFPQVIDLTTYADNPSPKYVRSLMVANEPDNNINQFYIYNARTSDKNAKIVQSDYNSLVWDGPFAHLSSQYVQRIGVKTFPQLGAMSVVTLLHEERSFILCPVFITSTRYRRPTFTVTQTASSLTFNMTAPKDVAYIAWRIVLRTGDTAFEYISYDDTLTVDLPYLTGTYDCYCVGYVGEGQAVSDDSEHVTLTITGTGEDPLDKFDYYTKADIDGMQPVVLTTTLTAAGWAGAAAPYSQTVQLAGIALTGYSYVASPAASDWSNYCKYGIYMNEPTDADSVTFYAISELPLVDLTVNILKVGVHS